MSSRTRFAEPSRALAVAVTLVLLLVTACSSTTPSIAPDVPDEPDLAADAPRPQEPSTTGPTLGEPRLPPDAWNTPRDRVAEEVADEEPADEAPTQATPAPPVAAASPTSTPSPTARAPSGKVRAAWVHLFDSSLKTTAGIDRVVAEASSAGVNRLIVQVVRRHDAYYNSAVLPRTADPALQPGLDVLAYTIERASAVGIAVEAWIVVAPTYHGAYDGLPQPDGWVYKEHGPKAPEAQRWVTRSRGGAWSMYLDPALPEVSDHVVRVATEIAGKYRVAGVHLDYVRYEGADWGYHPRVLERFRKETGRTDTPTTSDPEWSAWRRAQVTALAGRVTRAVRSANARATVSAATIAWGNGPTSTSEFRTTRTYRDVFQDWPAWVADGTIDRAYPMLYFRSAEHGAWFDRWLAFSGQVATGGKADVVVGVGAWLNPPPAVVDQLRRGAAATGGASVYSWQQPSNGDRAAALDAIRVLWAE